MKGLYLLKLVVVMAMVLGGCRGDVNSFRDCYGKCFIFCMIEPDKSLCTCTTQCLKECIFPSLPPKTTTNSMSTIHHHHPHAQNLAYCKLGCATSLCSNFSKPNNPGIYPLYTYTFVYMCKNLEILYMAYVISFHLHI